ncbi:Lysine--tRNA ligase [uncultured archaeon]|nr:Lysine--tRNA ligase [uncultured archaeon]
MKQAKEKSAKIEAKPVAEKEPKDKVHWADEIAMQVVKAKPNQDSFTVASGITPSGVVHIGNFREIITVDLVAKALRKLGKKVRFIYSWDDYDVFRKVPVNMPKQEMLTKHLRYPIVDVPDPFGKEKSYARHFEVEVERRLPDVGINVEFIYQADRYKKSFYAEEIKFAMINRKRIAKILDLYREEPLEENWYPSSIFCEKCRSDETEITGYDEKYLVSYKCVCGHTDTFDIRKKGIIKLVWRVDWPMRWNFEKVDFEPSGKDHSSEGGSNTTAALIVKELWGREAPIHLMYEFIAIKGQGGKMSSSKGNTVDLNEMLEVYSPELLRYTFASKKPSKSFEISFEGMDVIRAYSEFQKVERMYFGKEPIDKEDVELNNRVYELSCVNIPKQMPEQIDFRHMVTVAQTYQFDKKKIAEFFNSKDKKYCDLMVDRAKAWITDYAEESFKFSVNEEASDEAKTLLSENQKKAIKLVSSQLVGKKEDELIELFGKVTKETSLDQKTFFTAFYRALINKDFGPKLTHFMLVIGLPKVKKILDSVEKPVSKKAVSNSKELDLNGLNFEINSEITSKYPQFRSGIVVLNGVNNVKENKEITALLRSAENDLRARFAGVEPITIPQLKAWRDAYALFNGDPAKNKPSVDALVRRVLNNNSLPNINALVDLYNYISIKHLLPAGGDDLDKVEGKVRLCIADGTEDFFMIGGKMKEHPNRGEVIYRDDKDVLCRRWNWREADKTKFTESTKNAVVYIESMLKEDDLDGALKEFCTLAEKYLKAKAEYRLL